MKRKGQTLMMAIILSISFFMLAMLFINFLQPEIVSSRIDLDCSNVDTSDGGKLTCLAVDLVFPAFILTVVATSAGIILSRFII